VATARAAIRTKGISKPLGRYTEFGARHGVRAAQRRHPRLSRQGDALGSTPKGRPRLHGADPCLPIRDTMKGREFA